MISAFLAGFSRRDDLPQATRTQKQKLRPPVLDLGGYSHFPDGCECPILLLRLETNIQSVLCHRCSRVKGKRAAFPMSMVTSLSLSHSDFGFFQRANGQIGREQSHCILAWLEHRGVMPQKG